MNRLTSSRPPVWECKWCGVRAEVGSAVCPMCGRPVSASGPETRRREATTSRPEGAERRPGLLASVMRRAMSDPAMTAVSVILLVAAGLAVANDHLFLGVALCMITLGLGMFHSWAYVLALFACGIGLAASLMSVQLGAGVAVFQDREATFDPFLWVVDVGVKVFVLVVLALRRSAYF